MTCLSLSWLEIISSSRYSLAIFFSLFRQFIQFSDLLFSTNWKEGTSNLICFVHAHGQVTVHLFKLLPGLSPDTSPWELLALNFVWFECVFVMQGKYWHFWASYCLGSLWGKKIVARFLFICVFSSSFCHILKWLIVLRKFTFLLSLWLIRIFLKKKSSFKNENIFSDTCSSALFLSINKLCMHSGYLENIFSSKSLQWLFRGFWHKRHPLWSICQFVILKGHIVIFRHAFIRFCGNGNKVAAF